MYDDFHLLNRVVLRGGAKYNVNRNLFERGKTTYQYLHHIESTIPSSIYIWTIRRVSPRKTAEDVHMSGVAP
jgi:hypothetical protein